MMRSVLHYLGEAGLQRFLRHLRSQMQPGEYFVHQTASFQRAADAACMNGIYQMMDSSKWYPTVDFLRDRLSAEGLKVVDIFPSPALPLTQEELAKRYTLSPDLCRAIAERYSHDPTVSSDVFVPKEDGFCAYLHYWIYVCCAVDKCPADHGVYLERDELVRSVML